MKSKSLLVLALLLCGCATAPVSDLAPGERPDLESDEAGLWQAMERDEYTLRTSSTVIRDPDLQQYLESVLCRVSPEYCADVRIYVIPSPHFNAWMSPNGMMGIHTGLLLRIENEAQLAAVMGHELGHYQRRHTLQQWRGLRSRAAGVSTFAAILSAGASVANASANSALEAGDFSEAVSQAERASRIVNVGSVVLGSLQTWNIISQLQYSREHETESDDLGLDWLARSGYDPAVVEALWEYVQSEDELSETQLPGYLRTHPRPEDRVARNRQLAVDLRAAFPAARTTGSGLYGDVIAPYRHAWLSSARTGLDRSQEALLLERQRDLGVDPGLVLFHEAEMRLERNESEDRNLALETLQEAAGHPGAPPETHREIGLLLWEDNQIAQARNAFDEYLARTPDAPDAPLIRSYMEEMQSE